MTTSPRRKHEHHQGNISDDAVSPESLLSSEMISPNENESTRGSRHTPTLQMLTMDVGENRTETSCSNAPRWATTTTRAEFSQQPETSPEMESSSPRWWNHSVLHRFWRSKKDAENDDDNDDADDDNEVDGTGLTTATPEPLTGLVGGHDPQQLPTTARYTSMEEEEGKTMKGVCNGSDSTAESKRSQTRPHKMVLRRSLRRVGSENRSKGETNSRDGNNAEDAILENCSLFFRTDDDDPQLMAAVGTDERQQPSGGQRKKNRRGFRALRQHEHQHAFSYKDAVDVLAPTYLNHYKTRYEQLNQDCTPTERKIDRHSLLLMEDEETGRTSRGGDASSVGVTSSQATLEGIVRTDTAIHSSLFYQHHGRLLMRLPVDQVRLFMDPDLEPGVLSVEQWRPEDSDEKYQDGVEQPRLRYVLTINEDLYRRIVSDMSDGLTKPYCGISRCFHDDEKVDIRFAAAILGFILLILLINVFVWGPAN